MRYNKEQGQKPDDLGAQGDGCAVHVGIKASGMMPEMM